MTFRLTDAEKRALLAASDATKEARAKALPDDAAAIRAIWDGYQRLKELGWREANYAPCDHSEIELIEAGSTGIHRGYRDAERRFWIVDDDVWPSNPILWRLALREGSKA